MRTKLERIQGNQERFTIVCRRHENEELGLHTTFVVGEFNRFNNHGQVVREMAAELAAVRVKTIGCMVKTIEDFIASGEEAFIL